MSSEQGQSSDVQRLAALSDGIFAVAMTLLAFNVHVPNPPLTDEQLGVELGRMLGEAGGLLMSFAVAVMFWVSHFRLFCMIRQADYLFTLVNFGLLFSVVLLPISTSFRAAFGLSKTAAVVFGLNLALLSALNLFLWVYAVRKRWLPGIDRRFPAILLDLAPSVYSLPLSRRTRGYSMEVGNGAAALVWCIWRTAGQPRRQPAAQRAIPPGYGVMSAQE